MRRPDYPADLPIDDITLDAIELKRREWIEEADGQLLALPTEYPNGYQVPTHQHSRAQLLYVLNGLVMISAASGRWMVPPEYALWIPAGVEHSVEIFSGGQMHSLYVTPNAVEGLPEKLRVVSLTPLAQSLIVEAVKISYEPEATSREGLLMSLLLHEIPRLPEQPLSLPFPTEPKLAAICRQFVENPSHHTTIDQWARELAMSRRTFTRLFSRETGLSFSVWRQQACLLAALPRLSSGESVTMVAFDLGYESVAAFTTMFKRMLGASPRSYFR